MKHEIYFSHPEANDDVNKSVPVMIEVETDARALAAVSRIINAQDYAGRMNMKTNHTASGDWIFIYVENKYTKSDELCLAIFDKEVSELRSDLVNQNEELTKQRDIASANSDKFYKDARERNEELRELQKSYDKLDEAFDNLIDENYAMKCEISALKEHNDNLRKELKSALEALHDQCDDSDKPCCKKCVHCRPFVGSTDCYCSQTGELIKNNYAETYYCKEMIPYEDDYPF